MRVLLDTHILLWMIGESRSLSASARQLLADDRIHERSKQIVRPKSTVNSSAAWKNVSRRCLHSSPPAHASNAKPSKP